MKIYLGDKADTGLKFYNKELRIKRMYFDNSLIYEENQTVYANLNASVSGDSTIAAYNGQLNVGSYLSELSPLKVWAIPGDTILGQTSPFNNTGIDHSIYEVSIIQIGLNDLDPNSAISTAQTIVNYQTLVDKVRSRVTANCKIYIAKMLPCKQRLINIYGAGGDASQQRWVDINNAIMTTITGVDGRIDSHVPLLDDGFGNLKAHYQVGDEIHPNALGRQVIATAWRDKLIADNVLKVVV